jgi:hypothetical protein
MRQPRRALLLLGVLAVSAQAALAQLLPPLQPFEPLQPMQPFKPFAPLPPMQPMPGFPPFPEFPQMQMPAFPTMGTFGGGAAAGRAGGPGTFSASSSSSSFGGPRASTTPGCQVVQETSGASMAGSSKAGQSSCSLSQRVEICKSDKPGSKGHTRAVASVNGQEATCCVMLLKLPAKTPQMFCAAPTRGPSYLRMPAANTAVVMKPECSSSTAGRSVGSVSCTGGARLSIVMHVQHESWVGYHSMQCHMHD